MNEIHSDIHPAGTASDYARYDRIWQRVAPGQNPYPDVRASAPAAIPAAAMQPQSVIETPPQPAMPSGEITVAERREELMLPYRELLRERYHAAACNGLNYARTADSTEDYCLQKMMQRFSNENYAAADRLLHLLAQLC